MCDDSEIFQSDQLRGTQVFTRPRTGSMTVWSLGYLDDLDELDDDECVQSSATGYYEGLLVECNIMLMLIGILNACRPWSSPWTRVASLKPPSHIDVLAGFLTLSQESHQRLCPSQTDPVGPRIAPILSGQGHIRKLTLWVWLTQRESQTYLNNCWDSGK